MASSSVVVGNLLLKLIQSRHEEIKILETLAEHFGEDSAAGNAAVGRKRRMRNSDGKTKPKKARTPYNCFIAESSKRMKVNTSLVSFIAVVTNRNMNDCNDKINKCMFWKPKTYCFKPFPKHT
jgi:hypothetical protein